MPIVGERRKTKVGSGFIDESMKGAAQQFQKVAKDIFNEEQLDIFMEPTKTVLVEGSNNALRNYFVESSIDSSNMTPEQYDDHVEMMNELYTNNRDAITEYAALGSFNPVIGMSFPMHKNLMMNNIFENAIPKAVAVTPKFTLTMETRFLVDTQGNELDLSRNQMDLTKAIDNSAPFVEIEMKLPESGLTDVIAKIGASSLDNLSIETSISAIKIEVTSAEQGAIAEGESGSEKYYKWIPVNLKFRPGYGEFERTLIDKVDFSKEANAVGVTEDSVTYKDDIINGVMHKNKFTISSLRGGVVAIKLKARKDTSNGLLKTCSVKWGEKTDILEIPAAIPINTTIAPEEVKDIAALYNINQLTKLMSMIKTVMVNYKDDKIKEFLDESYKTLADRDKFYGEYDMAPRDGYYSDQVEWRYKTFMDGLDSYVTEMMKSLNDPNMTVTIFGRDDIIRKITPTEYTYQTPSAIGPVELDFVRTVATSDKRIYQFLSSQKFLDSNELIVILCPRNTNRIVYRMYDYQLYFSNEIRNAANPTLPAFHAFERWLMTEYQPVQGRYNILNPSGLKPASGK